MKIKNIWTSLAATTLVIAPLSFVVACKKEKFPDQWKKENDKKWNDGKLAAEKISQITQMKNIPLAAPDVLEYTFNSKSHGMLPFTRLQDFVTHRGMMSGGFPSLNTTNFVGDLVDTSVMGNLSGDSGEKPQPQAIEQSIEPGDIAPIYKTVNGVWNRTITKTEINNDSTKLDQVADEVFNFYQAHKDWHLGALVVAKHLDEKVDSNATEYTTGVFQISIFKLKDILNNSKLINARKLFTDRTKMSPDVDILKKWHGVYTTGQGYGTLIFSSLPANYTANLDDEARRTIFANFADTHPTNSPDFKDRSLNDTMKDWFAFGPTIIDKTDTDWKNWKNNITQQDIDSVKGVEYAAYYQTDWKTQENVLVVSAYEKIKDSTGDNLCKIESADTIYLPIPEVMSFDSKPNTDYQQFHGQDLVKQVGEPIVKDLPFEKIYDVLIKAFNYLDSLAGLAPSALTKIISAFNALQIMGESRGILLDPGFLEQFIREIPKIDKGLNLATFLDIIATQKNKDFEDFLSFGGLRYNLLNFIPRFYGDVLSFVNGAGQKEWQEHLVPISKDEVANG